MRIDALLHNLSHHELVVEAIKLRNAIRKHRDATGHNLCWLNNRELYDVLPEKMQPEPVIPPWPEFMKKCAEYREMLDEIPQNKEMKIKSFMITPDEAFGLALIAKNPKENADLLSSLSPELQDIAEIMIHFNEFHEPSPAFEAAAALMKWAKSGQDKMRVNKDGEIFGYDSEGTY